jgi:hypothetical protein
MKLFTKLPAITLSLALGLFATTTFAEDAAPETAVAAPSAPQASESDVSAAKDKAVKANEENHELRRQVNSLKVDLGISTIPTVGKKGAPAADAAKAEPAKKGADKKAKAPAKKK